MGAIFGKTKKTAPSRITEQDKAVLVNIICSRNSSIVRSIIWTFPILNRPKFQFTQQLKQQRDKLKVYQKRIALSLENDRQLAKKCLAQGRKEYAIKLHPLTSWMN